MFSFNGFLVDSLCLKPSLLFCFLDLISNRFCLYFYFVICLISGRSVVLLGLSLLIYFIWLQHFAQYILFAECHFLFTCQFRFLSFTRCVRVEDQSKLSLAVFQPESLKIKPYRSHSHIGTPTHWHTHIHTYYI